MHKRFLYYLCLLLAASATMNFMYLDYPYRRWEQGRVTLPGGATQIQVPFVVNPNFLGPAAGTAQDQINAINRAANTWNATAKARAKLIFSGQTSAIASGAYGDWCADTTRNAERRIRVAYPGDPDALTLGTVAATRVRNCGNEITHIDIVFNGTHYSWASGTPMGVERSIEATALHEFGHVLGLAHCLSSETPAQCAAARPGTDPPMTAAMRTANAVTLTLAPDDIVGLQSLYGLDYINPFKGGLVAIKKYATGSNSTEVHILRGSDDYQYWAVQTGTVQHESGAIFDFDFFQGRAGDTYLVFVQKSMTGSGKLEVHRAPAPFREFDMHHVTIQHEVGDDWVFKAIPHAVCCDMNIAGISQTVTGSGNVEVHILTGGSNYQHWLVHAVTPIPANVNQYEYSFFDYDKNGTLDLVAVKKNNTASGRSEVYVLSGDGGRYNQYLLYGAVTPIEQNFTNYDFIAFNYRQIPNFPVMDIIGIKRSLTGSNSTELHVLNYFTNYSSFILQTGTLLHETGPNFEFSFMR